MGCGGGSFHQQCTVTSRNTELQWAGITWELHGHHTASGVQPCPGSPEHELWLREGFLDGLFPGLDSWAGSFQEAGMGKSQADLLKLPQDAEIRAAESQPEGSVDKTAQEAQCQ